MNTEELIKERYQGDQGRKYHGKKREIPENAFPWVAQLRYEKIAPYVGSRDVVMEYGVGFGWNIAKLDCAKRLGFDLAQHLEPMVSKQGIEFVPDTSQLEDHCIDVLVCHHVLEHVPSPIDVLAEINRLLKSDGLLLLFVPYEKEKRYRMYDPAEPNHHLYAWNVQTLGNLVSDAGFTIESGKILRFGYDRFAAKWANKMGMGERGFRLIRSMVHLFKPANKVSIVAKPE
ncbi:MAG: class I SAM-dependent methyltransferase [Candidatus Thiodiazotropha sp. (ex Cardiolucina cf. quadrata)]|nr:class I SAM-dependent methyltransferase [Candidatus Thiodiazotropha sp. (ex Cardiolucina cf. quadrata)]